MKPYRQVHTEFHVGRLFAKGYITDPLGKSKWVLLTEEGARESQRLLEALFSRPPAQESQ